MENFNLLSSGANVSITIKVSDLKLYSETLINSAIDRFKTEQSANPAEVYYTIEKVCTILEVDRTTLFRWKKRDYLKSIKVGGLVRYRKSDIDNILNTGK